MPGQSVEGRKQFFFEKKNQKTFAYWARACGQSEGVKVLAHTGFRGGDAAMTVGLVSPASFALVPARSD
jgi:hypothetical protein